MKQKEQKEYLIPEIEVSEIEVERGFCYSNLEDIDGEKDPIEWD